MKETSCVILNCAQLTLQDAVHLTLLDRILAVHPAERGDCRACGGPSCTFTQTSGQPYKTGLETLTLDKKCLQGRKTQISSAAGIRAAAEHCATPSRRPGCWVADHPGRWWRWRSEQPRAAAIASARRSTAVLALIAPDVLG